MDDSMTTMCLSKSQDDDSIVILVWMSCARRYTGWHALFTRVFNTGWHALFNTVLGRDQAAAAACMPVVLKGVHASRVKGRVC